MIDRDLAYMYGVETKVLNQAVKRNLARFPDQFRFQLTQSENEQLVTDCDTRASISFSLSPNMMFEMSATCASPVISSP